MALPNDGDDPSNAGPAKARGELPCVAERLRNQEHTRQRREDTHQRNARALQEISRAIAEPNADQPPKRPSDKPAVNR